VGIYDKVEDIPFEALPKRFVVKATHACALNHICLDKDTLDVNALKNKMRRWLKMDYGKKTVEPHYSKIKPRLIVEHYVGKVIVYQLNIKCMSLTVRPATYMSLVDAVKIYVMIIYMSILHLFLNRNLITGQVVMKCQGN